MKLIKEILNDYILPLVIALAFGFFATKYIFFIAYVPTGSMLPTIQLKDRLYVNQLWNENSLNRGDVVVFESIEYNELFIKRLIGLPGDKVEIKSLPNGTPQLIINNEVIEEPYVKNIDYEPLEMSFDVPEEHFLFFGDNRTGSMDARFWEQPYIHKDQIKGIALFRVYPFSTLGQIK